VDSTCIVLLRIYSGVSLPKIIKFGWDFTKLYQFNIKQMKTCSFSGPPCMCENCQHTRRSCRRSALRVQTKDWHSVAIVTDQVVFEKTISKGMRLRFQVSVSFLFHDSILARGRGNAITSIHIKTFMQKCFVGSACSHGRLCHIFTDYFWRSCFVLWSAFLFLWTLLYIFVLQFDAIKRYSAVILILLFLLWDWEMKDNSNRIGRYTTHENTA